VTQKVHHQTERGARIALAKEQISRASYEAILAGTLSLAEARELERDRGPHDTGQASSGRERPRSVLRRVGSARRRALARSAPAFVAAASWSRTGFGLDTICAFTANSSAI
jgi:hypothetical protein